MFWWYTARKFPNCFILMLFPQLNGYWYQYQWVEKIPFDILMTPWHQYKTVYTLSRNKLHHGGGVQNSFLSIFGNQTDNSDNCSLISMTSGTKGYQLLCRELKDETPIKQLQHGGWLWGNLWGEGSKPVLMMISRNAARSAGNPYLWNHRSSCQQKKMQMNTQQQNFSSFNTKTYLKRN